MNVVGDGYILNRKMKNEKYDENFNILFYKN